MSRVKWHPDLWRKKTILQQPLYGSEREVSDVLNEIKSLVPLVSVGEIENLKIQLRDAAAGNGFILQGGDCVERFSDCNEEAIRNKMKILLQMSVILTHAGRCPVIKIGRMAGQYFKPRSQDYETAGETTIPVYRGDGINDFSTVPEQRRPEPSRLRTSYYRSAATLNFLRSMIKGGFADLHHPYTWNLHKIEGSSQWDKYQKVLDNILDSIYFMESFGGINQERLREIDMFVSHEGLHLEYERALIRENKDGHYYLHSTHMPWIGNRTRGLDSAHLELFRGIENPIAVKLDEKTKTEYLTALLKILNPHNEAGKILLITRIGAGKVEESLPPLIDLVKSKELNVLWSCDPMHGNTVKTASELKTRRFDDILKELTSTFRLHKTMQSRLSGLHFELTGSDVSECIGGMTELEEKDLTRNYESYCDPRLNYIQSMEMAFLISDFLRRRK